MYRSPSDHAIVVGINGYQDGIPALNGCVNDALLFNEWLVDPDGGGLDPANVEIIIGPMPPTGRPNRNEIEDIIINGYYRHLLQTGTRRGRRLYLYFAGHGVGPPVPFDEDCGVVMGNALSLSLRALLGRTTAKRIREAALFEEIVLFVDCCRQLTAHVMADCELPVFVNAAVARNTPYLYGMAAPWDAAASERLLPHPLDPAKQALVQGVFTHCLLRGLRSAIDATGQVTSFSLKAFVRSAVQELLPPEDNSRPPIELDEDLPPIVFSTGRPTGLVVAPMAADGRGVVQVIVRDGLHLDVVVAQQHAIAGMAFAFELAPARYLLEANDAAGQQIGMQPVELFGETIHVSF